ncbi:MAG: cytochrome c oxidase subunit II [Candidatus Poseidoniaceae archaeon]|nr:cytochrome c oxidase subunit II [Candidatus Poseidoniaceae archaeon]
MSKIKNISLAILSIIPLLLTFFAIIKWFQSPGTGAHAEVYDELFLTYWSLGMVVAVIVYGVFIWLMTTAVEEEPDDVRILGSLPVERGSAKIAWTVTIVITAFLLILSQITFSSIDFFENPELEEDSFTVKVTGWQYYWEYEYPNGITYTSAVGEPLRIPVDTPVVFEVIGGDVFHSFALPEHRIKVDALPSRPNTGWILAEETGTYPIRCYELCGDDHTLMIGELEVMDKNEFDAWYSGGGQQ